MEQNDSSFLFRSIWPFNPIVTPFDTAFSTSTGGKTTTLIPGRGEIAASNAGEETGIRWRVTVTFYRFCFSFFLSPSGVNKRRGEMYARGREVFSKFWYSCYIHTHIHVHADIHSVQHEEICIRLQSNPFFAVEKRTLVEPRRSKYNLEKDTVLDIWYYSSLQQDFTCYLKKKNLKPGSVSLLLKWFTLIPINLILSRIKYQTEIHSTVMSQFDFVNTKLFLTNKWNHFATRTTISLKKNCREDGVFLWIIKKRKKNSPANRRFSTIFLYCE